MEYKLHSIIAWAKDKPMFNCATFIGILDNYAKYHKFTKKQEMAIDNVFYKWKIEDWVRCNYVYIPTPAPKITKYFTTSESDSDSIYILEGKDTEIGLDGNEIQCEIYSKCGSDEQIRIYRRIWI